MVIVFQKILVIRRWSDTTIEIQNTNIEFDEKTLMEFQRNVIHIEENLKLFIDHPWHHAKKLTLPKLINFDQRNEVNKILLYFYIFIFLLRIF